MISDNPFSLRWKAMERLNLQPTATDDEYFGGINEALAALMNVTTEPPPDYVHDLDLVAGVERQYFGSLPPDHKFQLQYAQSISDSTQRSPFFAITAPPLIRCESLVVLLVNPPPKPVYLPP